VTSVFTGYMSAHSDRREESLTAFFQTSLRSQKLRNVSTQLGMNGTQTLARPDIQQLWTHFIFLIPFRSAEQKRRSTGALQNARASCDSFRGVAKRLGVRWCPTAFRMCTRLDAKQKQTKLTKFRSEFPARTSLKSICFDG